MVVFSSLLAVLINNSKLLELSAMARFRRISSISQVLLFLFFSWSLGTRGSEAKDTLLSGESLTDGEKLVSANKLYELKFINLQNSQNHYLAILSSGYDGRSVWIANIKNPLMDSSGALTINGEGNLVLTSGNGTSSTTINSEKPTMGGANTSATILDSGTLILKDGDRISWQSSDYPSHYTVYLQNDTTSGTQTTTQNGDSGHPTKSRVWLQVTVLVLIILSAFLIAFIICRLKSRLFSNRGKNVKKEETGSGSSNLLLNKLNSDIEAAYKNSNASDQQKLRGNKDSELPLFSFSDIESATSNFSTTNKLGEGGFGPVYKGKLVGGQEIAVKRLSKLSGQGIEQFKNEFTLISKLQHRNLVRILGCCIEGDEKILVYEYMPNKGLDSFLFDSEKRALLGWRTRINIIEGIAQGLLYLHKYSRLRIIHRDLKTSNVLLDCDMNPKISDFGTAKVFGENESQANTNRVIGTFGYMSPEYAMDGLFSEKSDVFSFGVMMLEIVSGKKNNGFYQTDCELNLLGYAWEMWNKGKILKLIDSTLVDSCSMNEYEFSRYVRYVNVGFLCVQESAADRPTMSEIVTMLSNETTALPSPKQPAFTIGKSNTGVDSSLSSGHETVNDVTISVMNGR